MSLEQDLFRAIGEGKPRMVIDLLERGANVNAKRATGQTPLHWAGAYGHIETAIALMKRGALLNQRDKNGRTPLDMAMCNGHIEMADAICEESALRHALRVELRNIIGQTRQPAQK